MECASGAQGSGLVVSQDTQDVHKWCPSCSSSVQAVPKLVHRACPSWALTWPHVCISKQFLSFDTLSVTAWTLLVYICEQGSFQLGHS